jgi:hypothetical protein
MNTREGKEKKIVMKKSGKYQVKVFRLIALEPALWDQYDRLADINGISRSTFMRRELKDHRRSKMAGVDWSETNAK